MRNSISHDTHGLHGLRTVAPPSLAGAAATSCRASPGATDEAPPLASQMLCHAAGRCGKRSGSAGWKPQDAVLVDSGRAGRVVRDLDGCPCVRGVHRGHRDRPLLRRSDRHARGPGRPDWRDAEHGHDRRRRQLCVQRSRRRHLAGGSVEDGRRDGDGHDPGCCLRVGRRRRRPSTRRLPAARRGRHRRRPGDRARRRPHSPAPRRRARASAGRRRLRIRLGLHPGGADGAESADLGAAHRPRLRARRDRVRAAHVDGAGTGFPRPGVRRLHRRVADRADGDDDRAQHRHRDADATPHPRRRCRRATSAPGPSTATRPGTIRSAAARTTRRCRCSRSCRSASTTRIAGPRRWWSRPTNTPSTRSCSGRAGVRTRCGSSSTPGGSCAATAHRSRPRSSPTRCRRRRRTTGTSTPPSRHGTTAFPRCRRAITARARTGATPCACRRVPARRPTPMR